VNLPDPTEKLIDGIIEREGREFIDHPDDKGGPTKFGITIETLSDWRVSKLLLPATIGDVVTLSEAEARQIYRFDYVIDPRFGEIEDEQLRFNVIDAGVLHGPGWAARRLQEVAGVDADGVVGPVTLAAVNDADPDRLNLLFSCRRIRKHVDVVKKYPSQLTWLRGWINRATWQIEAEAGQ